MADARTAILGCIRQELGQPLARDNAEILRAYKATPREYTQAGSLPAEARVHLLLERLADYDAEVLEVAPGSIAETVAAVLHQHGESVLLVPASVPEDWLPAGTDILRDSVEPGCALPLDTLTRAQAVLTACAGAIAETGTILLRHGAAGAGGDEGRRALTLLPDHHLCMLRTDQIVETVSEGLALLNSAKEAALTTVSGPSATADIEMIRIRGVHGPRRLTVLLMS